MPMFASRGLKGAFSKRQNIASKGEHDPSCLEKTSFSEGRQKKKKKKKNEKKKKKKKKMPPLKAHLFSLKT